MKRGCLPYAWIIIIIIINEGGKGKVSVTNVNFQYYFKQLNLLGCKWQFYFEIKSISSTPKFEGNKKESLRTSGSLSFPSLS